MSLTKEQVAFLERKWKTWFTKQDVNENGSLSFADFEEIGKRFGDYRNLEVNKRKELDKALKEVVSQFGVKGPDDKMTLKQFQDKQKELRKDPRAEELVKSVMGKLFDVVDANGGGTISREEYQVYFKCLGIDESNAKASFDGIDTSGNGVISREEYLAAAVEFLNGLDEKSGATLFVGPLVD